MTGESIQGLLSVRGDGTSLFEQLVDQDTRNAIEAFLRGEGWVSTKSGSDDDDEKEGVLPHIVTAKKALEEYFPPELQYLMNIGAGAPIPEVPATTVTNNIQQDNHFYETVPPSVAVARSTQAAAEAGLAAATSADNIHMNRAPSGSSGGNNTRPPSEFD